MGVASPQRPYTSTQSSIEKTQCSFEDSQSSIKKTQRPFGTLGEKTLHAVVKYYVEPDDSRHEIKVGAFYADIVNDSGIIEIQTRSFNALRRKLEVFLEEFDVLIVYPLPSTKWLMWIDEKTGAVTKKRKSPKSGRVYDAVHELYKIRPLLRHPNLFLRLMFIDMVEYRFLDGWSKDKKRGSTRYNRLPVDIVDEVYFRSAADYLQFVPDKLERYFTSKDYCSVAKVNLYTAQTALNILHYVGAVERVGKNGNLHVYERVLGED